MQRKKERKKERKEATTTTTTTTAKNAPLPPERYSLFWYHKLKDRRNKENRTMTKENFNQRDTVDLNIKENTTTTTTITIIYY